MIHVTMKVEGMTCGGCVSSVRNVLSRQPGVTSHSVEIGRVELDLDEAAQSIESIRQAIAKAGYQVVA